MSLTLPKDVCAMCGGVLSPQRSDKSVLCASLACAHAHAALPTDQRCGHCSRPVPASLRAARQCGRAACQKAILFDGPMRAERERRAELRTIAVKRRRRAGAQSGLSADEVESYPVAMVPRSYDRLSKLPKHRVQEFEAHLRQQLLLARERLNAGLTVEPPTTWEYAQRELTPDEATLFGAGCAACRGYCCRLGEAHAFVRPDTMARYIVRFPGKDDEGIVADYLHYLAPRTLTKGCVFQLADGCAMPREMRSDTCNTFLCDGLTQLRDARTVQQQDGASARTRAYFVNVDGYHVRGGEFVDVPPRTSDAT